MGRKRKLQSPEKMPPSSKQTKVSTEDPVASDADDELQKEQTTADEPTTPAKEKRWKEKCRRWIAEQQEPSGVEGSSESEQDPLEEDEPMLEQHQLMDEPAQLPSEVVQRPLRNRLKDIDEKQIFNSVMFECEWQKCGFETDKDMDYMNHVEDHLRAYLRQATDIDKGLSCFWDLCDYKAPTRSLLESHVHFHVYHNRIKTFGASLGAVIHIPKCNNGSQRRNNIEAYQITFRCEWADCSDEFQKAQYFFQHVNHHVMDQFPVDKKSSKHVLRCEWNNCTQEYTRRSLAIDHMKKHSTERTIGCYNCGAIFVSRLKYIDHCKRQVDYHNREYPCTECEKLFATKQLMIDHRNIHNKKFACTQCPMKFPSKKALSYHIRYRHINEKPFQCQLCSHRTVTLNDLKTHSIKHDPVPRLNCSWKGCIRKFKQEITREKHMHKVHMGFPRAVYACHLCTKNYTESCSLSRHLTKIHDVKREPGYVRFRYRQDNLHDGKYRLASFLDQQDWIHVKPSLPNDTSNRKRAHNATPPAPVPPPPVEQVPQRNVTTKYSIALWRLVGQQKIAINMLAECEPVPAEVAPVSEDEMPLPVEVEDGKVAHPKRSSSPRKKRVELPLPVEMEKKKDLNSKRRTPTRKPRAKKCRGRPRKKRVKEAKEARKTRRRRSKPNSSRWGTSNMVLRSRAVEQKVEACDELLDESNAGEDFDAESLVSAFSWKPKRFRKSSEEDADEEVPDNAMLECNSPGRASIADDMSSIAGIWTKNVEPPRQYVAKPRSVKKEPSSEMIDFWAMSPKLTVNPDGKPLRQYSAKARCKLDFSVEATLEPLHPLEDIPITKTEAAPRQYAGKLKNMEAMTTESATEPVDYITDSKVSHVAFEQNAVEQYISEEPYNGVPIVEDYFVSETLDEWNKPVYSQEVVMVKINCVDEHGIWVKYEISEVPDDNKGDDLVSIIDGSFQPE